MSSSCDVLIIGGGVIGLACAHYLAADGHRVRLVERRRIGAGASHGNCGLVFTSDLVPLCAPGAVSQEIRRQLCRRSALFIRPRLDPALAGWLFAFAACCTETHLRHAMAARKQLLFDSEGRYRVLFEQDGLQAEQAADGVLMVFADPAAWHGYQAVNARLQPHGCAAQPLSAADLQALEPALAEGLYGGWLHRGDSHLRPDRLLESWRRLLQRQGVAIEEGVPLAGFRRRGTRIEAALTPAGEIRAGSYLLAAGVWTPALLRPLGVRLPIVPGKGYSLTMAPGRGSPGLPCYFYERRTVATPWPSGLRLGGIMEFTGFDERLDPKRLRHLRRAAGRYLKNPPQSPEVEQWSGLRPMTYDELPVIGPAPGSANLWLAAGHGMLGISTAPATGRLAADLIAARRPSIDPAPFSPARFRRLRPARR